MNFSKFICRIAGLTFIVLAWMPACSQTRSPVAEHTLRLTPAAPSSMRRAEIVAPGGGNHGYNVYYIDARSFGAGGVLDVDIQIDPGSATSGSFDLFPPSMTPELLARPGHLSLAGSYDIGRGASTRLEYRFPAGQVFVLGLEGNWGSPRGARGTVQFRASVTGNDAAPAMPGERTLMLTPGSPSVTRRATIIAPGNGQYVYNLFFIDARSFHVGGVLDIDIQIDPSSGTDGSFDLWQGSDLPPSPNRPGGRPLAGRYDIRRGASTRIEYRFTQGRVFALALEGNWFSPKGATGSVAFRATVQQ